MGCKASSNTPPSELEKEVQDFLTTEEIRLVKESWLLVATDLPAAGLLIFTRLFELQSDFKKLFRRLMTKRESGEYVFDSVRLENHATKVLMQFGQAVDNLDNPAYLSEILIELGERHTAYNVKPEMLPFLWPAIRDGLKTGLGDKFTTETELAWKHFYDYISHKVAIGMTKGEKGKKSVVQKKSFD